MGTQRVTGTKRKRKRAVPDSNQGKRHKESGFEKGIEGKVGVCSVDKGEVGHPREKFLEG